MRALHFAEGWVVRAFRHLMRFLLLSASSPTGRSFGALQRTTLLRNALRKVGDVTTLVLQEGACFDAQAGTGDVLAQVSYPSRGLHRKYGEVPHLGQCIRSVLDLDSFDAVVSRYIGPMSAMPAFRGWSIVDADDAAYRYPDGHLPGIGSALAVAKSRIRLHFSRQALRRFDHAWFCCERDRAQFALVSSSILPNVSTHSGAEDADVLAGEAPCILFVGALWYQPNRDAVDWFANACWPAIRAQVPTARFRVVGPAAASVLGRWARIPGVECPGFVDDLAAEYRHASFSVVPVRAGGGTQIKTLESLAHGRVPLVTPFVADGFAPHLKHGESLLVADGHRATVRSAVMLLQDSAQAARLALRGRVIVQALYTPGAFETAVSATFARLAARRAGSP